MQIRYVRMPLSIEEKKELNAKGFKVVDAKFEPVAQTVETVEPVEEVKPKPKRKTRAKKA